MPPRVYMSTPRGDELPAPLFEQAALAVLEAEGILEGELSLTFLPDEPIRVLNQRWRGHDSVPDVLSFGLHEPGEAPVGDIYVGVDQAARQASEHGVPDLEELVRLVIHGTLHVLGYEHPELPSDAKKSELYRKQELFVQQIFAERSPEGSEGGGSGRAR